MAKEISASEFAELAGVTPSTTARWGRNGFPGARQVPSSKKRPMWVFEAATARKYAAALGKVNAIFPLYGR